MQSLKAPNREAHCILTTPRNDFLYVPCVKTNNAIFQFAFDYKTGQMTALKPFNANPPALFGPRHAAYHPTLPIVYFSNEQQLGVSVYTIAADGQLADLQHAVTMPRRAPFQQGKRDLHASDLVISDNGTRLYIAVRDFAGDKDSVFCFRIEADGRLSQIARRKVGDIPWKLALSADGKILIVSETGDRRLTAYRVLPDGELSDGVSWKTEIEVRDMVAVDASDVNHSSVKRD